MFGIRERKAAAKTVVENLKGRGLTSKISWFGHVHVPLDGENGDRLAEGGFVQVQQPGFTHYGFNRLRDIVQNMRIQNGEVSAAVRPAGLKKGKNRDSKKYATKAIILLDALRR